MIKNSRLVILALTVVGAFSLIVQLAAPSHASYGGRAGFSGNPATNGNTCALCHQPSSSVAVPTVAIIGDSVVEAGSSHTYQLLVTGGPAQSAGFNLSLSPDGGALDVVAADTQLMSGELTHTAPKPFTNDQATFDFAWTAPSMSGTITMYAAVNSSNGNSGLNGDGVGTAVFTVTVQADNTGSHTSTTTPMNEIILEHVIDMPEATVLTHAGDERLFVASQNGVISVLDEQREAADTPYLDLSDIVHNQGEMGLLGLAFHPDYADNGHLYVNYVTLNPTRTVVARYTVSADPNTVDPTSETIMLEFEQPYRNHKGGDLHFGADGYLYIASGDGGGLGDLDGNAQNTNSLLGKMLRIDVDTTGGDASPCALNTNAPYTIPADNRFANGGGCGEIYALGLRNPWRFSFDRLTGDMWIGDVGQYTYEEINLIPAGGSTQALNFGWNCMEGDAPYDGAGSSCSPPAAFVAPAHQYGRDDGCSVTGGFVYRGSALPEMVGRYFYTDLCNQELVAFADGTAETIPTFGSLQAPVAFGEDVHGELYVLNRGGYNSIYQIRPLERVWLPTIQR